MKNIPKLHLGNIICNRLCEEGRTKKWLAKQVCCDASCLGKMLKKNSLDTDLLLRISFAMRHNFSEYLTNCYNEWQILPSSWQYLP